MKKIRIIALLLAALTMIAALAGCGETNASSGTRPARETTPNVDSSSPADDVPTLEPETTPEVIPNTTPEARPEAIPEPAPGTYSEGLEYELNDSGTGYIVSGIGSCQDTDIIIPAVYNGLPVMAVGNAAFQSCTSLTSVTIPESVIFIFDETFAYCESLTSVSIPRSVTRIELYAFKSCDSLTNIQYGGTKAKWEEATHNRQITDYGCTIICTDGTIEN